MKNITKTTLFASLIAVTILSFTAINFADADQINEKDLVEDKIKDKMQQLAYKDQEEKDIDIKYTAEEYGIPYNLVFEDNGKLIVGIDAEKTLEFQERYSKEDVKIDLDTDVDLDVKYYVFENESNVRGGDALTYGSDAATITVVKNNKIVTTGHAFSKNNIVNAGLVGGTACQEVKITKDNNYDGAYADASYGIDTYNSACDNNYVNNSLHYNSRWNCTFS